MTVDFQTDTDVQGDVLIPNSIAETGAKATSALKSGCKTTKRPQTGPDQDCKRPDQQSGLLDFEILGPQKDRSYWTGCVGQDRCLVLQ